MREFKVRIPVRIVETLEIGGELKEVNVGSDSIDIVVRAKTPARAVELVSEGLTEAGADAYAKLTVSRS